MRYHPCSGLDAGLLRTAKKSNPPQVKLLFKLDDCAYMISQRYYALSYLNNDFTTVEGSIN